MSPIGVFDSGYGGLTVLRALVDRLPQYDYLYLGDNARAPYGTRSFETVYRYTLECVEWLLSQQCPLIILACNTASAKALRTIQQNDLDRLKTTARVLGVIRPTAEVIGNFSKTKHIGILATTGTVKSESYLLEIEKFFPGVAVMQEACPMWVPLIENGEHTADGADYFISKHLNNIIDKQPQIDTMLLACTHFPLLKEKISSLLLGHVAVISQADIVGDSTRDYLQRHKEIGKKLSTNGERIFYTTDSTKDFDEHSSIFFGESVSSRHLDLQRF
jgi:glutamate racemase